MALRLVIGREMQRIFPETFKAQVRERNSGRFIGGNICWLALAALFINGCSPFTGEPRPGPDKQATGLFYGAAAGAGSGAVTGFQVSAATGPGAVIGGGFGAAFGLLSGLGVDLVEEDELRREEEQKRMREISWVHEMLSEHYSRRLELHPNRDIYPADWFFEHDSVELKPESRLLISEIAHLTRRRMPWSRMVVAAYTTASEPETEYSEYVTRRRAENIARAFVRCGIEPRRIEAQAMTLPEPILIDPEDYPGRYRQAIEIIPLDY